MSPDAPFTRSWFGRGRPWGELVILLSLAGVAILWNLGTPAVYLWDEARVAISALEMIHSGNFLVVTFGGEPDMWNPKPPLAVWTIAASTKLFGTSEWALRLPSALAAIATTIAVWAFTKKVARSGATGVLAAAILLGTGGYVEIHVARTADADSLLVLFVTLAGLTAFAGIEIAGRRAAAKWLYWSAAFLTFAIMTKGVAGLLMVPSWLAYALLRGKLGPLVRCRATWVGASAVILVVASYFAAREVARPGFLLGLWRLDVVHRIVGPPDLDPYPWTYYLRSILSSWQGVLLHPFEEAPNVYSAFPWSVIALLLAPFALASPRPRVRRAALFLSLNLFVFLAAISALAVKVPWYLAPAYPLVAMLAAMGLREFGRRLRTAASPLPRLGTLVMPAAMLLAVVCVGLTSWKAQKTVAESPRLRAQRLPTFLRTIAPSLPADVPFRAIANDPWEVPPIRHGTLMTGRATPYDGASEYYVRLIQRRNPDSRLVFPGYKARPGEMIAGCGDMRRYAGRKPLHSSGDCVLLY